MDTEWCVKRLEEFLDALHEMDLSPSLDSPGRRAVMRRQPTAQAILQSVDPGDSSLDLDRAHNGDDLKARVLQGIGIVTDRAVLSRMLAPDAPVLAADRLHGWVWEPARPLWEIGQFRQALLAAATAVNAQVQAKVGRRDISDDKLFQECLSSNPPLPNRPRLRVQGDPTDQTVQSLQRGALSMALGCVWTIRNPAAHLAAHDAGELGEQEAFEQLATLSVLARLLEGCQVITAEATDQADESP